MIKPLLRTIPTLSGNVKLACTLLDYNKINKDTFETNIRGAHIYPLSSQLFQKSVQANLLNSSWEYDLKTFYSAYADTFFEPCFDINKSEMPLLDKTSVLYPRNTDFEYGVKRISYSKSGCQYAFFAPIYIDNVNDIPDYFDINIVLRAKTQKISKKIRVNIGSNANSEYNYIYKYLYKYLNKIDDNVAYMNNTDKTISYYGIDLINGGFTKYTDSTVSSLFNIKLPIQLFDYTITSGFKRNNICMRQSLPLCFYFNIFDILTNAEREHFKFAEINFSGAYYKNDVQLNLYDFDADYDNYTQQILVANINNGELIKTPGNSVNIMDASNPAFNDRYIINYQFANKLTTTFNRWKLKYSSDDYPYITNMSWAFSNNQDSNYKYKEYPSVYLYQAGYAIIDETLNNNYNLLFPLGKDINIYNDINVESAKKYKNILNNYCLHWFDTVTDSMLETNGDNNEEKQLSVSVNKDKIHWTDVNNGYTYFNGVLYNLNSIYNKLPINTPKLDKFAVLVYPNTTNIYTQDDISTNVLFAKYSINQFTNNNHKNNCTFIKTNIKGGIESCDIFDVFNSRYNSYFRTNPVFEKISGGVNTSNQTYYVNVRDLDIKYEESNVVYNIKNFSEITNLSSFSAIEDDEITAAITLENSILNLISDNTEKHKIIEKFKYFGGSVSENENKVTVSTPSDIGLAIVKSYNFDITKQDVPQIFVGTAGINVFNQIDIYRGAQLINNNNKFNISDGFTGDAYIYINLNANTFDPIKEKVDNNTIVNINNISRSNSFKTNEITFYNNINIINKQYFTDLITIGVNENIVLKMCNDKQNEYNFAEVDITDSKTNKLYEAIKDINKTVLEACYKLLNVYNTNNNTNNNVIKYEFLPVNDYNNRIIGTNIVKEIKENFYIEEPKVKEIDDNVIYIHPYNIRNICSKIIDNPENIDSYVDSLSKTELYGKMLNDNHVIKMIQKSGTLGYTINLFKQYKKLVFNSSLNIFTAKYYYEELTTANFVNNIKYDAETGMFYEITKDNKKSFFNIVDHQSYIKMTEPLYNLAIADNNETYLDMFVYRPIKDLEYDEKFCKKPSTDTDEYNCQIINAVKDGGILENTDTLLYPCFNDFYVQEKHETVFYKNISANNIQKVITKTDKQTYYRYNCHDGMLMLSVNNEYLRQAGFVDSKIAGLDKYTLLSDFPVVSYFTEPGENIYSAQNIGFFTDNNINYGYCMLNVNVNNTKDFFNIRGVLDTDDNSFNLSQIDEIQLIKYITYINGIDITDNKEYLQQIFKQLCPFIYTNLISYLNILNIMMSPTSFSLLESYNSILDSTNPNIKERKLVYTNNNVNVNTILLLRYTDAIVPNIVLTENINNLYYTKYKTINSTLLNTGKYNSIGDSIIYSTTADINKPVLLNIYNTSNDINIKNYNNVEYTYLPVEYKYYNASKYINLPTEFEYSSNKLYTYGGMIIAESEQTTIEIFKKYVYKYITDKTDDNILFLYKKYKTTYKKDIIGATIGNTNKIYKLTYKFTLL